MGRLRLPASRFLLLPGVDTANFLGDFWGDLLRHFSLEEHMFHVAADVLL